MKLFSIATLLVAVVSTVNALIITTPTNVVACQPLLIIWDPQDSTGPFFLSVLPGDSPTSFPIISWSGLTGNTFTWIVDQAAGTSLGLSLRDQTGIVSTSAIFTVKPGSTTTCLNSTTTTTTLPVSTSAPFSAGSGPNAGNLPSSATLQKSPFATFPNSCAVLVTFFSLI